MPTPTKSSRGSGNAGVPPADEGRPDPRPTLVTSSHAPDGNGHALDYCGRLVKTPALHAPVGASLATPAGSRGTVSRGTGCQPVDGEAAPGFIQSCARRLRRLAGAVAPLRVREWPDAENRKLKTENLFKPLCPPEYYPRESANLRLFGPDAEPRAEKIRSANFRSGTVVIPAPATPSRRWA